MDFHLFACIPLGSLALCGGLCSSQKAVRAWNIIGGTGLVFQIFCLVMWLIGR